jgi:hypothetical protein
MDPGLVRIYIHGLPSEPCTQLSRPGTSRVRDVLHDIQAFKGNVSFSFTTSGRQLDAATLDLSLIDLPETVNGFLEVSVSYGAPISPIVVRNDHHNDDDPSVDDVPCRCDEFYRVKGKDQKFINWTAINGRLPGGLHVMFNDDEDDVSAVSHLVSSLVKKVFYNVPLKQFHDGHVWVEVNDILCVGRNARKATQSCFYLVHDMSPDLSFFDKRQQKYLTLCMVPSLIANFGRKMTIEQMCAEMDARLNQPVAVIERRPPRRLREADDDEAILAAEAIVRHFGHAAGVPQLFEGIVGTVDIEAIRGPIEQLERALKRVRSKKVVLGGDEDEKLIQQALGQLVKYVEQSGISVGVLVPSVFEAGTVVAYSSAATKVSRDPSIIHEDDIEYRLVVAAETVDLLLNPHHLDVQSCRVAIVILGTVPGVRVQGEGIPGDMVYAFLERDGPFLEAVIAESDEEPSRILGTVHSKGDEPGTASILVRTSMWAHTILRDALGK